MATASAVRRDVASCERRRRTAAFFLMAFEDGELAGDTSTARWPAGSFDATLLASCTTSTTAAPSSLRRLPASSIHRDLDGALAITADSEISGPWVVRRDASVVPPDFARSYNIWLSGFSDLSLHDALTITFRCPFFENK